MGEPTVEYDAHEDAYRFTYEAPCGLLRVVVQTGRGLDEARATADKEVRAELASREVECVGGPADGVVYVCSQPTLRLPAWMTTAELVERIRWQAERGLQLVGLFPEWVGVPPMPRFHVYADTGRRTADGRRVFAPEGEPAGSP